MMRTAASGTRWHRPKATGGGPGSRIPTVIVSPYAKKGVVDHTVYDTTSILQFLSKRFGLEHLRGIRTQFGDLRNAFAFGARYCRSCVAHQKENTMQKRYGMANLSDRDGIEEAF